MNRAGTLFLLFCIGGLIAFGLYKRVPVLDAFLEGAKESVAPAIGLLPSFTGLLLAVQMLEASGFLARLADLLTPYLAKLGFPVEILPLCLLSPVSGSGSIGAFQAVLAAYGPDSFVGRTASVLMASTETAFYTVTVYFGAVGVKKIRHTVLCALCADMVSCLLSGPIVRLFFNQ